MISITNDAGDPRTAEIEDVLARLENAWNADDYDAIASFWDRDDPTPFYQAEEEEFAATDWAMLDDYFTRTRKINEHVRMRITHPKIKFTGQVDAVVIYQMRWEIKFTFYPKPLGGDGRVLAMLQKRQGVWKFHTYIEATISPITYMRKLYESQVGPGFESQGR